MKDKYKSLLNNLLFYQNNLPDLQQVYQGQYLLIWEQMVAGTYPTYEEAVMEGNSKYASSSFLVKQCRVAGRGN